ncbi:MAG TPA: DUF5990 family protein [Acidimicrobiales bacterium]|nr:DUF5990 family protein [Acidimicrobiales bacterium]
MAMLNIRIVGERLPGRVFGEHGNVHVGVQRGDEVVQIQPADAASVRFTFGIVLREQDDGSLDFRSPFVHGKPGDRFLYLSWGDVDAAGRFTMFRRLKLMLNALPQGLVTPKTGTLEGYLTLTDDKGGPRCAAIRPPEINWSSGG